MSTSVLPDRSPPVRREPTRRAPAGLFRAFWRWHFYASFLVIPILLVLSTTGLIYLFRFQIEPLLNAQLMRVEHAPGAIAQPYAAQQRAVEVAHPDATLVSMTEPAAADHSTRFSITTADGAARDVFVDPWTAEVLGDLDPDTTLSGYAVRLHGELMAGKYGEYVMELGACWAVVMALTGYYLLVKGRKARKKAVSRNVPGAKLRRRHAFVGGFVGVGLLFLLVSGLPWTALWGANAQEFATSQGTSFWSQDHGGVSEPTSRLDESLPHSHRTEVPWAQGGSEVPRSTPRADGDHVSVANIDTAVTVADREGLRHPMTVAIPRDETGVFSVIGYAFDAPTDERTVHVDQFGGDVVSTYGFDDYPALAKVVSLGIGLHEGRSLGAWSFAGSMLMCLAVMFSCITGPLMWWRRRPKGNTMGAPRGRMPMQTTPLLGAAIIGVGLFLPMFGLSLLVVLLLNQLVIRRVPRLAGFFGSA